MLNKKLWGFFIILLLSFSVLSGCGYKDIDKRYFVVNMGIDHNEGGKEQPYTISIKIAVPTQRSQQPATGDQSLVFSIDTQSISNGLEILKSRLDREVDFGHLKVLMVDPYVASHDIKAITSWFIERRDIQKIAYIAIAEPDCKTIMNFKPETEKMPSGTLLLQFGDTGNISPYTNTQLLFGFFRDLYEKGNTAILPIIKVKDGRFEINTVGLFDDAHLVGTLSADETLLLNSFVNHRFNYSFKLPLNKNQGMASFRVVRTKLQLHVNDAHPSATIWVKAIGNLGLPNSSLSYKDELDAETIANQKLKKKFSQLFIDLQKKKVDPVGLGLIYRSHHFNHSQDAENWEKIYPELTFKVNVDTSFKENGITG